MGIFDRSEYEVAELIWENGQIAMHGFGNPHQAKPTWGRANETLESVVQQATSCYQKQLPQETQQLHQQDHAPASISSAVASSNGKWMTDNCCSDCRVPVVPFSTKKRTHSELIQCETNFNGCVQNEQPMGIRVCPGSPSATFCRENAAATMTWTSFDSSQKMKSNCTTKAEDSTSHGGAEKHEDPEMKTETVRSQSSRKSRAAVVHNQSERRRRDRINQKMKELQKLVPNASQTDKASMLDEVIEYLKQLQAQVQMMNNLRNMPQMMMPIGIQQQQQQLQWALLARMGMGLGLGMGMLDMNPVTHTSPVSLSQLQPVPATAPAPVTATAGINQTFASPLYVVPPMNPTQSSAPATTDHVTNNTLPPLPDPYCAALLAQSMNMDIYNKIAAAIYQQRVNQSSETRSNLSQPTQEKMD